MKLRAAAALLLALSRMAAAQEGQSGAAPVKDDDLSAVPAQEAVVEGARRKEPASESLRGRDAKELPGTHGDALVAAQMLPAVARQPVGSGQLVVWGAAPRDTRILLDGIELPALYHGGGLRSVIPTELVKRLALSPAAFGPQYGRALGGVLSVETEAPAAKEPRLQATLDPLDAHASVEVPVGAGNVYAGARYSLLDRLLGPALSTTARELFPIPRYWDGQLVAAVPLRDGEKLELLLLGASDASLRSIDAADPAVARGDSNTSRWGRLGLRYRRELGEGAAANVVLWAGDDFNALRTFAGPALAEQTSWAQSGGLRTSYRTPIDTHVDLTVGTDAQIARTHLRRTGSLTTPPREGDLFAFGQAPGDDVAFDDWTVVQADLSLYAASEISLGRFTVSPGLRLSAVAQDVSRLSPRNPLAAGIGSSQLAWFVEPRLAIAFNATAALRFFAAGGLHHQPPAPEDLSAVFGTPALTSATAVHASAGAGYKPFSAIELEATGFFRGLTGLASRSGLPTPRLAQALVQQGAGDAYGGQLVARFSPTGPLNGFVSVLISRSERQDLPGAAFRAFDFDQPISITAAVSYRLGPYTFGARARVAAGYPRTPVVGAYLDSNAGRYDPIFGLHNGDRLPAVAQLDLRADRTFELGKDRRLKVSLEVQNAAARSNPEEFGYSSDWSARGTISGLPPIALLGLELVL